jgi:hypothetical protein
MSNTTRIKFNSSTGNQRVPLEIAASRGRTPQIKKKKKKKNRVHVWITTELSSENTIQQIRLEREGETESTFFFCVAGDRSGRQIHRRQNAGEGWPGGGWPTIETEADRREGRSRPVSGRERERGRRFRTEETERQ